MTRRSTSSPGSCGSAVATFNVPLILRGKIIDHADIEYGGRRGGSSFTATDVRKHLDRLPLASPSALEDLHRLKFEDIADFLEEVGLRLSFRRNTHLQEAYELSVKTSGLSPRILEGIYATLGQSFSREVVRQTADKSIGIPYLDGWVTVKLDTGGQARTRAFGARAVHIIAGNIPNVAAMSIARNAITRSDMIVKTPSNDPLTAAAVARTLIEVAPDHPITRHLSVAYWKGGDQDVESSLYNPANVDKIVAWGGLASITHISKYIQPGIDLITLDPKLSSTIIGKEAFATDALMREVAGRAAVDIGHRNQQACHNARVIYIQTGTDAEGLRKASRFARHLYDSIQALPPHISSPAVAPDPILAEEVDALRMSIGYYEVIGGGPAGAVIVSQIGEPVDFARMLADRVANLVPFDSLETPIRSTNAYTQTIGIYPDSLRAELRDRLALHGAQRLVSLGYAGRFANIGPHDGIEPLRRMCKWIVEEEYDPALTALASKSSAEIDTHPPESPPP
jgi:hypothetical protein